MPGSKFASEISDAESLPLPESIGSYAIFRLDRDGFVISWNAGARRIKGYAASEIIGSHFSRFFTVEDQISGRPALALSIARQAGRFEEDGWRVRNDGGRFRASVIVDTMRDNAGQPSGFVTITRETGVKHAAPETLLASERRYRLLIDNVVHYAIYTLDTAGCVTSWNSGAARVKGYRGDEILGQHFSVFYTAADRANGRPADALKIAQEDGRFEDEGWRVRKDGMTFWASVVLEPILDESNRLVGFAKVTRDITEKRSLDEAREQFYRAQKMETLGQLTGAVAHDFNNLLAAVTGSLDLMAKDTGDLARVHRLIEIAKRAATRGAKLTEQLLSFSRRQVLKPETSNINDLITKFGDLLRRAGGDLVEVQTDLDARLWPSEVDQAYFLSALMNLVVNARDAMADGGLLTIETRNVDLNPEAAAELTEIAAGPYVVATVRDTGAGMTAEVKARATEPFYTTKDIGQGSGLGLSQAYGFARQSHGQLHIWSEVGTGTSVSMYLPRSARAAAQAGHVDRPSAELGGGTILVVEDDPDVLEIAVEAITSFGYAVHSASDGHEALTVLQRPIQIDLLFTDVMMPHGMSGVELAREACRLRPRIRVLLASGYPRKAIQEREGLDDCMEFIAKPYDLSVLSERLRTLTLGPPN